MYEELMNLVQSQYNGDESDEGDEEGTQSTSQVSRPSEPRKKKERAVWGKKNAGRSESKSPSRVAEPALDRTRDDPDFDSDDNDSGDDELGRNVEASPVVQSAGKPRPPWGARNPRFEPKMSEVVEETEPESSFKDTGDPKAKRSAENFGLRKKASDVPHPVPEVRSSREDESSFTAPPDRDDDFSDDSGDEST